MVAARVDRRHSKVEGERKRGRGREKGNDCEGRKRWNAGALATG
jgi:hypothetical protein